MGLLARRVNGSDIENFFLSRIGETSPRQTDQANRAQNDSNDLHHTPPGTAAPAPQGAHRDRRTKPPVFMELWFEHSFDLPDLLLHLAGQVLYLAFGLQARIAHELARLCLNLTLYFIHRSCNLVLGAGFHVFSSTTD